MIDNETLQALEETAPEQSQEAQPRQNDVEKNLVALREARARAERERDEALAYAKMLSDQQRQNSQPDNEDDTDLSIEPEALAEGRHLKKVVNHIKKLENELPPGS